MLFKGTATRSAEDIARSVDSIGGNLDAFTAKELVCYNTKVLDQHLPHGVRCSVPTWSFIPGLRRRISRRSKASFWKKSRWRPTARTTWCMRSFPSNFWKDHPLGKPILGTPQTVKRFDHDTSAQFLPRGLFAVEPGGDGRR